MRPGEPVARSGRDDDVLRLLNHRLRNTLASLASALHILKLQGYVNSLAEEAGQTIERQMGQLVQLADDVSGMAGTHKDQAAPGAPAAPGGAAKDVVPRRILIVDDNRDAAYSTATLLALGGHWVRVAYDGEQALNLARQYQPEVCLLDLIMPGMDGFEVAQQLRKEPGLQGLLLAAMTGLDDDAERAQCLKAGFDAYLLKPVPVAALESLLNNHAV